MRGIVLSAAILLTACGGEGEPQSEAAAPQAADKFASAQFKLDPILFDDMEANDMLGDSCAFGASDSVAQLALVKQGKGFLNIDGTVEAFAPEDAAEKSAAGYPTEYAGSDYSFALTLEGEGEEVAPGKRQYDALLVVKEGQNGEVLRLNGYAQCNPLDG